jgi:hypothetical protein
MAIMFFCSECEAELCGPDDFAGMVVECGVCGSTTTAPRKPPAASSSAPFEEGQTGFIPLRVSDWEKLRRNPADALTKKSMLDSMVGTFRGRLFGHDEVERDSIADRVILRRTELQYESQVEIFVDNDRNGFDVAVPSQGFKIRITCPRVVPANVLGAPWNDLLEKLCEIDRSVIKSRGSKAQPMTCEFLTVPHPLLRVEVLAGGTTEERPSQPPQP